MSVVVDHTSGEVTVEIPDNLTTATFQNPNTETYNDYLGIKPPFGLPDSVMPGEVPYTSTLPYLVHPALRTHPNYAPNYAPNTDQTGLLEPASPLYANFIPPAQVGGYSGAFKGYAGNTYLPDDESPLTRQSNMMIGGSAPRLGLPHPGSSADPMALLNLAPNDQVYIQSSGSQVLRATAGSQVFPVAFSQPQQNTLVRVPAGYTAGSQVFPVALSPPPQTTLVRVPAGYTIAAHAPGTVPGSAMVSQPGLIGMTSFSAAMMQ